MSSKDKHPIAVDEKYNVRDNQFWYNDCKFRHLIEDKSTIEIRIEYFGTLNLTHSKQGTDGRPTLSYTLPHDIQPKWEVHRGELVKVELMGVHA
jgi:hypothetical protein